MRPQFCPDLLRFSREIDCRTLHGGLLLPRTQRPGLSYEAENHWGLYTSSVL